MSANTEDRLYGLMEIAERQQAAVQAALEGLAAERAALRREREMLAYGVRSLEDGTSGGGACGGDGESGRCRQSGSGGGASRDAAPLGKLLRVTESAGQAEAALRGVVLWASWRLLAWIVASVAALVLLGWLASSALLWWDTHEIGLAQTQKAQLQVDIAALQANHDDWVKSGMLGKLTQCGPISGLAFEVNEDAGAFESDGHNDYRVIQGY